MSANPILVQLTRGNIIESFHRGSYAIVDCHGTLLNSAGNIETPVFPRSAIKGLQALLLVGSGAAQAFNLSKDEIAVACASHNGEDIHVNAVRSILHKSGISETQLECGFHWPTYPPAAGKLTEKGQKPSDIHNNCSGKHAAMLATAHHLGEELENYTDLSHPVQQRVSAMLSEVCDCDLVSAPCGIDGCSVPTWALSLEKMAYGFARLSNKADTGWRWDNA